MAIKSTTARYGSVAVALHWISALAILALIPLGFLMAEADPDRQAFLYGAHVVVGLTALLLTLLRVVWWLAFDRRPADMAGSAWQAKLAKTVHGGFYLALLVLGASGVATMALSGAGDYIFEQAVAPPAGIFEGVTARSVHGLTARILIVLLVLHIGAAGLHHFARRDGTLRRILPGA